MIRPALAILAAVSALALVGAQSALAYGHHGGRGGVVFVQTNEPGGNQIDVLNPGGTGIVHGFWIRGSRLVPISGSARSLGLANSDPPNFLTAPGQAGFTPDGSKLLVTTKASTSSIDVFSVGHDGRLSATPVVNPSATPVPFALTFGSGRLVDCYAAASSVTTDAIDAS